MVAILKTSLLLLIASLSMGFHPFNHHVDQNIRLYVDVHDEFATEDQPFYAKLTIYHPENMLVDEASFKVESFSIKPQLLSQGKQSSMSIVNGKKKEEHLAISYYIFEVSAKAKGQHVLPPVQVKVGDQVVQSEPKRYTIHSSKISDSISLNAQIDAPKPLYPGQDFSVTYQILFTEPLEIFYENLPLLDLKDCQKIGKQKKRVYYQNTQRIEEYTQTYHANKVGAYSIEPSFIEARKFSEDFFGRRHYKKGVEKAQTEKLEFSVLEFPVKGRPKSFYGALGDFEMNVLLDSSSQVCLGDKVRLKISIKGSENLNTINLPNIALQENFKDLFRISDLPKMDKSTKGEKIFLCELRPMNEEIREIPPIEFSYFNPRTKMYHTIKSAPIPITLLPLKSPKVNAMVSAIEIKNDLEEVQNAALQSLDSVEEIKPALIDIQGVYPIDKKAMPHKKNYHEKEILVLLTALFLIQLIWRNFFLSKRKISKSRYFLQLAFKCKKQPQKYQQLLEKAMLLRLKEQNLIKEYLSVEQLNPDGIVGQVKKHLYEIQMQLFSKQGNFDFDKSLIEAKILYKMIGEVK